MMPRRLLFIYAHPDDESFAAAGIARMYANEGVEIALVTATRGDAGRAGEPAICGREQLPARREAELREAAAILGINDVTVLRATASASQSRRCSVKNARAAIFYPREVNSSLKTSQMRSLISLNFGVSRIS